MSKASWLAIAVLALLICLDKGVSQTPSPKLTGDIATTGRRKGPDIGFDYRKFVSDHLAYINSGQIDKAIEHFRASAIIPKNLEPLEDTFRRGFASIYGSSGKMDSFEFVGYKR